MDERFSHNTYIDYGFGARQRAGYFERVLESPLVDITPLFSGFIAGVTGRSVVAVTDRLHYTAPKEQVRHGLDLVPDNRDMPTRIRRRGMLYGVFFWLYTSLHRRVQFDQWYESDTLRDRVKKTVLVTAVASAVARLSVNVWTNISDAAKQRYMSRKNAYKYLTRNETMAGLSTIFAAQPPLSSSLVYHGSTIFLFEALRRGLRGYEPLEEDHVRRTNTGPIIATALFNGTLAAGCATAVSAATLWINRPWYKQEVLRPNALAQLPNEYIFRREAIMVGITYGVFTLLQPYLSPHHSRCGFGY